MVDLLPLVNTSACSFLPCSVGQLVQEKEHRLRMMMKMHGLQDGAYWCVLLSGGCSQWGGVVLLLGARIV